MSVKVSIALAKSLDKRTKPKGMMVSHIEGEAIPEAFVGDLVNRAGMTRLPQSNRETVKRFCGAGYSSLNGTAQTDLRGLKRNLKLHFDRTGMKLSRSFIDLDESCRSRGNLASEFRAMVCI